MVLKFNEISGVFCNDLCNYITKFLRPHPLALMFKKKFRLNHDDDTIHCFNEISYNPICIKAHNMIYWIKKDKQLEKEYNERCSHDDVDIDDIIDYLQYTRDEEHRLKQLQDVVINDEDVEDFVDDDDDNYIYVPKPQSELSDSDSDDDYCEPVYKPVYKPGITIFPDSSDSDSDDD